MEIEWDPGKNEQNIAKHGVTFAFALGAFAVRMLQWRDTHRDYGEDRWVGIAELEGRVYVLVWTMRGPERVRLISARKANERETKRFRKETIPPAPDDPHEP